MKKMVFTVALCLMAWCGARAEKVPESAVRLAAERFMCRQRQVEKVELEMRPVEGLYLFQDPSGGFVLMAGDDCVRPVLGYSLTGFFADTMPEHVSDWMKAYAGEIGRQMKNGASDVVKAEWEALMQEGGGMPLYSTVVSPMLTTTWKQGAPFNTMCPYDNASNQQTISGCVAIAMAQVMKYWNHPAQGEGSYSYNHSTYGSQSVNFAATSYDWINMPNSLTSVSPTVNINAVATLVYHAGVSVKMNYGTSSSGATTISSNNLNTVTGERALRTYFRYDKALHSVRKEVVSDSVWMALIDGELDESRPVIYSGHDTSGGHAFICDGRNNAGYYHFNWGWGGYCDGYYVIGALNPAPGGEGGNATSHYNLSNRIIVGIMPDTVPTGSHTITAVADNSAHGSVTGGGSYNYGDTVELTALANNGYRFARWSDGMCYNPRKIIVGGDKTYTALYDSVYGDTLRYDNGVTVTSWGYSTARPFYWGMKIEPDQLAGHAHLSAVQVYLKASVYKLMVYSGNTPSSGSLMDSLTFTTGEEGWHTVTFSNALTVNAALPMWIVLYNDSITYPGYAGVYCGHQLAAYSNTNGTSWSTSSTKRTFLIRAIFYTSQESHTVTVLADEHAGRVTGNGSYPENTYAEISASALPCHRFVQWSDGVADNPRQLLVQSDTVLTALFDSVEYHSYQEVTACDSLRWIDGVLYTESTDGVETLLTSVEGCDSLVTLSLSLGHSSADTVVLDTMGTVVWEGAQYSESGVYTQTYHSQEGCDSLRVLVLTVSEPVGVEQTVDDIRCRPYPNPTTGKLYADQRGVVEVYDCEGRKVARFGKSQPVDLGALPDGVYTLTIEIDGILYGPYRVVKMQ